MSGMTLVLGDVDPDIGVGDPECDVIPVVRITLTKELGEDGWQIRGQNPQGSIYAHVSDSVLAGAVTEIIEQLDEATVAELAETEQEET